MDQLLQSFLSWPRWPLSSGRGARAALVPWACMELAFHPGSVGLVLPAVMGLYLLLITSWLFRREVVWMRRCPPVRRSLVAALALTGHQPVLEDASSATIRAPPARSTTGSRSGTTVPGLSDLPWSLFCRPHWLRRVMMERRGALPGFGSHHSRGILLGGLASICCLYSAAGLLVAFWDASSPWTWRARRRFWESAWGSWRRRLRRRDLRPEPAYRRGRYG
jgi:hypothetical protein